MSGGYDLQLIIKGRTFQEVALFVAKRLSPLDDVLSTATHFVLRIYKREGKLYQLERDRRKRVYGAVMDYDKLIAPAAAAMRPSGIRKFFDLAAEMPECISLSVGEPDFRPPGPSGRQASNRWRWATQVHLQRRPEELRIEISRYLSAG